MSAPADATSELSPDLLAILACPEDKGPLYHLPTESVLYNPRLARTYEVRDGIPVMLIDEATSLDDDEARRLDELVERSGVAPTFEQT